MDSHWTETSGFSRWPWICRGSESSKALLRTPTGRGIPIAGQILDMLLDLPPCKHASVVPLQYISCVTNLHGPQAYRFYNGYYMENLCRTLENWLQGVRDARLLEMLGERGENRLHRQTYLPLILNESY